MPRSLLRIGGHLVSAPDSDPAKMPCRTVKIAGAREGIRVPKIVPHTANAKGLLRDRNLRTRECDGIFEVTRKVYWGVARDADTVTGQEFERRCKELDQTHAGKRARELLFRYLSEDQRKQVEMYNYFDVVRFHPWNHWVYENYYNNNDLTQQGWGLPHVIFRLHRGRAMANVELFYINGLGDDRWPKPDWLLCIQTREPHPIDDIIVAQKFMIENATNEFVRTSVLHTPPPVVMPVGRTLKAVFSPPWLHPDWSTNLELPFIRDLAKAPKRPSRRESILAYIDQALDYA